MDEAASPLPRLETTPPVTKMYFGIRSPWITIRVNFRLARLDCRPQYRCDPRHRVPLDRLTRLPCCNVRVSNLPVLRSPSQPPDRVPFVNPSGSRPANPVLPAHVSQTPRQKHRTVYPAAT